MIARQTHRYNSQSPDYQYRNSIDGASCNEKELWEEWMSPAEYDD